MPEAVIVAATRSPIGRAYKGSLRDIRPDDLAATIVALDQVPHLDPEAIDDLLVGCGQPGGESGYNLGRVVAVRLGYDHLPGATITRYCSSSLQTTRMAMHAIRAGEGDVVVSAGVETVSRAVKGNSDTLPDAENPVFATAKARTAAAAESPVAWHDPREDGALPDVYITMGQTAENVAALRGITRAEQDEYAVRSQNRAEQSIKDGFYAREITPVTLPDNTLADTDDGPPPGVTLEAVSQLKPVFRPGGTVTAGNCCPLNDGAAAVVVMSDRKARELGDSRAGRCPRVLRQRRSDQRRAAGTRSGRRAGRGRCRSRVRPGPGHRAAQGNYRAWIVHDGTVDVTDLTTMITPLDDALTAFAELRAGRAMKVLIAPNP